MSTLHTSSSSVTLPSNPNFDPHRWVIRMRRTLEEELEDETDTPVCIFNVPKTLMLTKPEAYIPQHVALGPYHCWRPELYDMERFKLAAAKRTQKQLQTLKFHDLVCQIKNFEPRIRGCYHKYLDFNGETLAWMMAIDASFLLEFLQIYANKDGKFFTRLSSGIMMSHLLDHVARKSAHNLILRDIILLENQIPLFLVEKIMEFQYQSTELAHDTLLPTLIGLCKEISPFTLEEDKLTSIQVMECAHLLDFLYSKIVPKSQEPCEIDQIDGSTDKENSTIQTSNITRLFDELWKLLYKLYKGVIPRFKSVLVSKPVKVIAKLPWMILTCLPGYAAITQPVNYLFFTQDKEDIKPEGPSPMNDNKPPLIEEITIPSVTELAESGVHFTPIDSKITSIRFDVKTGSLHLPTISLDVNTEVVLRNLVAYEASCTSGPLVLARYTELMNGIIDTEEDAKLLRERGIVLNRLKSDSEVAELWNGMSRSVRLTKVPFLDKVIEDVNKYYSGRWKIKIGKFMKFYVFASWKFLTLFAATFLLLLVGLQAFCSLYRCFRILHTVRTSN